MRSLIAILITSFSFIATAQTVSYSSKDTIFFAPDSSYSRSVQRDSESLIFGTSKSGIVAYNEKTKTSKTIHPPSKNGEFRDIAVTPYGIIGLVSGDNGELVWVYNYVQHQLLYKQKHFFDAMDVRKEQLIVLADPIEGKFPLYYTNLEKLETMQLNSTIPIGDEACYAASGTTIQWLSDSSFAFISGGTNAARFHRTDDLGKTWLSVDLPLKIGTGCGPFSMLFMDDNNATIVGGCYALPNDAEKTSLYSQDAGKTWHVAEGTNGYRSCVTGNKDIQFTCGTNGIEYSTDKGKHWFAFDSGNYCALLFENTVLYATTNKGKCVRYEIRTTN